MTDKELLERYESLETLLTTKGSESNSRVLEWIAEGQKAAAAIDAWLATGREIHQGLLINSEFIQDLVDENRAARKLLNVRLADGVDEADWWKQGPQDDDT